MKRAYRKDSREVLKYPGYASNFWSGSPNANNSDNAWNVNFNNGNDNNNNKSNSYAVRVVRDGEWLYAGG